MYGVSYFMVYKGGVKRRRPDFKKNAVATSKHRSVQAGTSNLIHILMQILDTLKFYLNHTFLQDTYHVIVLTSA